MGGCKRCKNQVTDGLKCLNCGTLSHRSCLKSLKNVKYLSDKSVICCAEANSAGTSSSTTSSPISSKTENPDKIKIELLQVIINQKDLVIENQKIAITALTDQIALLKLTKPLVSNNSANNSVTGTIKKTSPNLISRPTDGTTNKESCISANDIAIAVEKAPDKSPALNNSANHSLTSTGKKTSSNPTNRSLESPTIKEPFISPNNLAIAVENDQNKISHTRKSGNILIGSRTNDCPFKAAKRTNVKYLHATNFDPDVCERSLEKYLRNYAPGVQVVKLNNFNPSRYSSFKIEVPSSEIDRILIGDIWPSEVIINQFFRSKKLHGEVSQLSSTSN